MRKAIRLIAPGFLLLLAGILSTLFVMTHNRRNAMRQGIPDSYYGLKHKGAGLYMGLKEHATEAKDKSSDLYVAPSKTATPDPMGQKCPYAEPDAARARPLTRAVVVYLSVLGLNTSLERLTWCMRSLLEVVKTEPPAWRTDIVIYTENVTLSHLVDLGCKLTPRRKASDPFKCILVKHIPISSRIPTAGSTDYEKDLVAQLREYPPGDSLIALAEKSQAYVNYDYVVRVDLGVVFTPAFGQWLPPHCGLVTGTGGYGDQYNMHKLGQVANNSGTYFNSTVWNIGSTWIGSPSLVAEVAKRAVYWMVHLSKREFSPKTRSQAFWGAASMWPEWHYGVLGLYASHIAINEVLEMGNKYPFTQLDLDNPISLPANCTLDGPIHLHTYHLPHCFGAYNGTDLLSAGSKSACCDYAGYIAADSLNITATELSTKLRTIKL
ncbi:hypothetical protein RvY_12350 [Ramazzottius varieornatus]|uniref:DUF7164 domain-containing protein n=1 Tax=Ramazzottius varieornatus TaxID=947166 RepID=A0A1D1VLI4_RAMVA|nr:hypothetical protein RvY_12350 [Ramazzottius varieornatus]